MPTSKITLANWVMLVVWGVCLLSVMGMAVWCALHPPYVRGEPQPPPVPLHQAVICPARYTMPDDLSHGTLAVKYEGRWLSLTDVEKKGWRLLQVYEPDFFPTPGHNVPHGGDWALLVPAP